MRKPFNGSFILTQGFGENPASYAQFGLKGHNGLDYGLPTSTVIVAPHSGTVIEATNDPQGYGLYLKIENEEEGSVLAHLKEFKVKVGDKVVRDQLIALSDNTGNSTGPHLHWGYYKNPRNRQNGYAGFINQLPLIQSTPTGEQMATITQKELDEIRVARDTHYNDLQQAKTTIENLNKKIKDGEDIIKQRDIQISTLQAEVLGKQREIEILQPQADKLVEVLAERDKLQETLTGTEQDLTTCKRLKTQLENNSKDYTTAKVKTLISELLKALIEKRW